MKRGVTLLELLIVVGIVGVLVAISIPAFSRYGRQSALAAANEDVVSALSEARNLSLSSLNASVYGVHFETSRVIRFTGTTYATSSATSTKTIYEFDPRVRMVSVTLSGGGSDVTFKRLSGEASKTGTVVLAIYNNDSARATTTIYASGIIR